MREPARPPTDGRPCGEHDDRVVPLVDAVRAHTEPEAPYGRSLGEEQIRYQVAAQGTEHTNP
jgi:hypothetical protein